MTREQMYDACLQALSTSNCLILEAATGTGKSLQSIKLINNLCRTKYDGKKTRMLLLVAKRIHKITWKKEFEKWGGIDVDEIVIECYESLRKHAGEFFDFIVADEVHHLGSEIRQEALSTISFGYMIGLSATVPRKTKAHFRYKYHAEIVSCNLTEAIEDEVLPEPEILLFPLQLDNKEKTETWEFNPKAKGPIVYGDYENVWKYKKNKVHAILKCTKKQKSNEFNSEVLRWKNAFNRTRSETIRQIWQHTCTRRLEFYSTIKLPIVKDILKYLDKFRTITFCKTIEQCTEVGKWCIHSKNSLSDQYYEDFNNKKINHLTAVNILNENANLVDCKYAIFDNLSSSEVVVPQRLGRAMRHKKPVIIIPYYEGTREQEIVESITEGFNEKFIHIIHSIKEIL